MTEPSQQARRAAEEIKQYFADTDPIDDAGALSDLAAIIERETGVGDAVKIIAELAGQLERYGEWDDGCFYHEGRACPHLEWPLRQARAYLAKNQS